MKKNIRITIDHQTVKRDENGITLVSLNGMHLKDNEHLEGIQEQ